MMRPEGDSLLSAHDMRLWGLVQHVLVTWATLVIFKDERYSVPEGRRGLIEFFVPQDATFRDEIVAFLRRETDGLRRDGCPADPARGFPALPGTDVRVLVTHFSGVMPHITIAEHERMIAQLTSLLVQRLKRDEKDGFAPGRPD